MIYKPTKTMKNLKLFNRKKMYFQVGVFGSDGSEMVQIAGIHEFGGEIIVKKTRYVPAINATVKAGTVIKIPERKWLTLTFERNKKIIDKIIKTTLKKIGEGKLTVDEAKEIIAISLASLTKKEMGIGVLPPKHREGRPMVDTGDLRRRVGAKVNFEPETFGLGKDS